MEFKISKAELFTLLKEHHILRALQRAGVDNWSGYEYALENYLSFYKNDLGIETYDSDGELSDFDFEDLAYRDLDLYSEFTF